MPATPLGESACRAAVQPWPLHFFPTIGSTSDAAREGLAAGTLSAPVAVVADRQTAGRGRMGRTWHGGGHEVGTGISATFALAQLAMPATEVPLVAAVLVRRALSRFADDVRIKWPNDLVRSGDAKIGGLLCERVRDHDLIGVGVNVMWPADAPADLPIATLAGADRTEVLAAVAGSLAALLDTPPRLADALEEYRQHDALVGRIVHAIGPVDRVGPCRGIDDQGRLRVGDHAITTGTVRAQLA